MAHHAGSHTHRVHHIVSTGSTRGESCRTRHRRSAFASGVKPGTVKTTAFHRKVMSTIRDSVTKAYVGQYIPDVYAMCNCSVNAQMLFKLPVAGQVAYCESCTTTFAKQAAYFSNIVDKEIARIEKQVIDAAKIGSSSGSSGAGSSGGSVSFRNDPLWADYKSHTAFNATHTKGWNVASNFNSHVLPAYDNDPTLWTKHKILGRDPASIVEELIDAYEETDAVKHVGPNGEDWKAGFKTKFCNYFRNETSDEATIKRVAELMKHYHP